MSAKAYCLHSRGDGLVDATRKTNLSTFRPAVREEPLSAS